MQDKMGKYKAFFKKALPLLDGIVKEMEAAEVADKESLVGVTMSRDGYLSFEIYGTGYKLQRLNWHDPVSAIYTRTEQITEAEAEQAGGTDNA